MKYKIYQVNMDRGGDLAFLNSSEMMKRMGSNELDSSVYDLVYEGEVPRKLEAGTIEYLFQKFNVDLPDDYHGRSMSVSDIIEIVDTNQFYYVDSIGFSECMIFDPKLAKNLEITEDKIRVVLCEPGKKARVAEIGSDLESMQRVVGGYIEALYPSIDPIAIVCNEEGKINRLPLNRSIRDEDGEIVDIIAGTCFICDCSGEAFGSLSDEMLKKYKDMYYLPERFYRDGNEIKSKPYNPTQGAR